MPICCSSAPEGDPPGVPGGDNLRWPRPHPGTGEPDDLFKMLFRWHGLESRDFGENGSRQAHRIRYIKTVGRFRCQDRNCKRGNNENEEVESQSYWVSHLTWVRFDLMTQAVELVGQKCKQCLGLRYNQRYMRPLPFKYEDWKGICIEAIHKTMSAYPFRRYDPLHLESTPSTFRGLSEEELRKLSEMVAATRAKHTMTLCQRCVKRRGPCWTPHHPGDCARCQAHPEGICFSRKVLGGQGQERREVVYCEREVAEMDDMLVIV